MESISVKVIATLPAEWKKFAFIQDDNFKDLSQPAKKKLRGSILANQFTQPFYVWKDEASEEIFCLDGKHRSIVLQELINEGYTVPDLLPATFISCESKQHAAGLVLQFSSVYAKVSEEGLSDFISAFQMNIDLLANTIDLPGVDIAAPLIIDASDPFNDIGIEDKSQYGVMIVCKGEKEQEEVFTKLTGEGYSCKVVVT